ncbi:YitT family protein [Longirhabdus pacifica]|uniref:YitT family protein n=1 Tax=Longirhabdus pacifica TaxID=2305227 RepID=UPI001009185C|nr:YitT family protein [Longirhabdus pacifica]
MSIGQRVNRLLLILLGSILVSISLETFFVPNDIIDGGIVGVSLITSYLADLPLGLFLFIFNLPFLFLGYKQIGKTFAIFTLIGVSTMSLGTFFLHSIHFADEGLTKDPLLAAVFGGVVLGIGVGLVIRSGGSLDGTEIVAILFSKKLPFSVGEVVMFFNLFILGTAGFVFGWNEAMYSLIAYFIAFKMIDITIEGFDESKSVWIISDNYTEIGDALLQRLGRGVTYLNGEGGFSHDQKKVIFTVITRLEEAKLKSIVEELDPAAFLAVGSIHDVKGGRFKKRDIH